MQLASFFLVVPLLQLQARQHCLEFNGKSYHGWSADFIFWPPALCQGCGVGARRTAAQLLSVNVANNSNYRQAVRPHERCPQQSWPISCSDGVCSVSLLQHCQSYSAQDDGGWTALQKLIKQITANILIVIFIKESDAVWTECLLGLWLFKSLWCFHEAQQEVEQIQVLYA